LCWQTVEQQFNPALAIASAVGSDFKKTETFEYYEENIKKWLIS
jgi:hypothetical protein